MKLEFRLAQVIRSGKAVEKVKVSSRGQIAIPKQIRDALHIASGNKLEICVAGDEIRLKRVVRPVEPTKVAEGRGLLAGRGRATLGEDEVRNRIVAGIADRDAMTKKHR